ncbi:spore coat protein [Paenibacillus sp.]|jgi:spore coat protein CotF|uniref:spore coat protein n=1 Tax=Paenibacillus sp. TaxID=58172 RepID=UPI002829D456|nr:spore coat protein [Paenibacillus sp.]MDR0268794.1 spore coat protein [Paenibacillus sp.]
MMNQNQNNSAFMQDEDLLYTILADLKRTVREYTTATTESACPMVRQMFTQLTDDTLRMQGELYNLMSQLNMYSTSSSALRQDLDKQLKDAQNTQQQTRQFVQQKTSSMNQNMGMNQSLEMANTPSKQQEQQQNPYYM